MSGMRLRADDLIAVSGAIAPQTAIKLSAGGGDGEPMSPIRQKQHT
jgi:hypothetical protein